MTISIRLPDDAERRLTEAAKRLNVPVEDLAAAAVRELVTPPAEDFEAAAQRVLEKNRNLYRRLCLSAGSFAWGGAGAAPADYLGYRTARPGFET